ncbi:hypothetical protein KQX54_011232 [Cotesia glomerata]|uniref:Uncharacterized protein n=1 Tax=Cotesia glomerata TaxID=32391 RepID=A0AAV7IYR4_COTGL|nr:hypothetical protein KQX54_011232 [Cotesia glomerata]
MIYFNCKEQGYLARACLTISNHQGAPHSFSQENLQATSLSEESTTLKKPEFPSLPPNLPGNKVMMNALITTSEKNAQAYNNKRPKSEGSSQTALPTKQVALPTAIEQVMTSCPIDFPCSFTQLVHCVNDAPRIHSIEEALQKHCLNAADTVKFRFTRITTRIEGGILEDSSSQSSTNYNSIISPMEAEGIISDLVSESMDSLEL